jgi:hypothetical protein
MGSLDLRFGRQPVQQGSTGGISEVGALERGEINEPPAPAVQPPQRAGFGQRDLVDQRQEAHRAVGSGAKHRRRHHVADTRQGYPVRLEVS